MKNKFRKFIGETKGIAAIEFALIVPFMLLIYFGLFDITALVSVNRKVTYAASVVADLVAQNKTSVLKADIQNYFNASDMVMAPMPAAAVRVEVFGFRKSGSTISQIWKIDNGLASSCGAAPPPPPWTLSWSQETILWSHGFARLTKSMPRTFLGIAS